MSAALHFWQNLQAIRQFQVLPSASTREETCVHYLAQILRILMWQWLMPVFFLYAYLRHVEAASLVETAGKCSKVLFQSRNLMQIDGYFDKGYSLSVVIVISANWLRLVQPEASTKLVALQGMHIPELIRWNGLIGLISTKIDDQNWSSNKATTGNRMEQQRQGPQFNWQLETWKGSTMVDRLQLSNHLLIEDGTKSPCRSISCSQWALSWVISSAANLLLIPPSSPPHRRGNTAESCQPQGQRHSLSQTLQRREKSTQLTLLRLKTQLQNGNHFTQHRPTKSVSKVSWKASQPELHGNREWLRTIHSCCV